jgi:hypothetical protein
MKDDQDEVRKVYPHAHCAPLADAVYPDFYVIRADRAVWSDSLATGPTPEAAWHNARMKLPRVCGACGCKIDEDGCGCNPEGA